MDKSNEVIVILIIIIIILSLALGFKILNKTDDNIGIIEAGSKIKEGASEVLDSIEDESHKWNAYNKTYEKYKGEQSGSNIIELLEVVKNHNFLYGGNGEITVEFEGNKYSNNDSIEKLKGSINNTKEYVVSLEYSSKTSIVNKVIIK